MLQNLEQELFDARTEDAILHALWRLGWWVRYGRLPTAEVPTSTGLASLLSELPPDIREECEQLAALYVPSIWDDNVPNVDLLERMPEWTLIRYELPDVPSLAWEASVRGWGPDVRFDLEQLHVWWIENPKEKHPAAPLIRWWIKVRPRPSRQVHAKVLRDEEGACWTRTPGLMSRALLAPVSAISVDGLPVGSAAPVRRQTRLRALPPPTAIDDKQLHLLPGPLRLRGTTVDPVIEVTAAVPWADDRSVLRSDVIVLVRLGCAIVSALKLPLDDLVRLLRGQGGNVKQRVRSRALAALQAGAAFVLHGRFVYQMVRAYTEDGYVIILPADWFRGGRGQAGAWRLSGALWRKHWTGAKQGGMRRTAEGIEAGLAWTPPTGGRGELATVPVALIPDTPGGAGPEVFIEWQRFLYLSGESWPASDDESARRLWRTRVERFVAEGYRVSFHSAEAEAGDTWEIMHIQRGGLHVRAGARFCRAVALSQLKENFELLSVSRLIPGSGTR